MELRCENRIKFGEVLDDFLEVVCRSNRCGAAPGVVVIHRFSLVTGEKVGTRRFRKPYETRKKVNPGEFAHTGSSVRST